MSVCILGGYQTDFSRNWTREGLSIDDMIAEVVVNGLNATEVEARDVGVVHVGNFAAELFAHQGMLGGIVAEVVPGFDGIPISRHEAACASGSMAVLAAMADIESNRYDVACVVGVELMRNVSGEVAAQHLASAAWQGREAMEATYCWPHMFNHLAAEYDKRYGLDYAHIGRIAEINYENGRRNPNAQTRGWRFEDASFSAVDEVNPVIDGMIRRNDCGQVTDGAAMIVLCSEAFATRHEKKRNASIHGVPRIKGWGHKTARMSYNGKVADSKDQALIFPHVAATIQDALGRAKLSDAFGLDAIETHDCFAITEYMAIDHFGITAPGQSWKAVEDGLIAHDGQLPINPSGGLIGLGHPVGATGVRMLLDGYKQVAGCAGEYQVEGARNVGVLNIGGSTTTVGAFVVGI